MEKDLHIYHHLGLGDHIICNAIVRIKSRLYENIILFVKPHNYNSVKFMFRDISNISYVQGDDVGVNNYLMKNNPKNLLIIGHHLLPPGFPRPFDILFYETVNIPYENRYLDFFVQRDLEEENKLLDKLNIKEPYIFLHEDLSRGLKLDRGKIKNKELRIIESSFDFLDNNKIPFFYYMSLIEKATEIHVMESSFKALIDSYIPNKDNMFLHIGTKGDNNYSHSKDRSNWIII